MNKTRDLLSMLAYFIIGIIALILIMQILGGLWRLATWLVSMVLAAVLVLALGCAAVLIIKLLYATYKSTKQ